MEAAILFEANWTPLVDEVWVTVTSESAVVHRAIERTGLPEKQIRERIHSQLSNEERIRQADVVITNPTELAVALKYDHDQMPAPKVVAKGSGFMAQRIREIANEHGVPILERKPLAQALYKACEIGEYIPPELYKAVAEVLAHIFELAGKGYRKAATG